jgi:hypothetical protein
MTPNLRSHRRADTPIVPTRSARLRRVGWAAAVAIAVVVSSLVVVAPSARAATSPAVSVAPGEGIVGSNVTVSGSGFLNLSSVRITFNDSSGHSVQLCSACAVGANGSFSDTFLVPQATNGTATVAAAGLVIAASTEFVVVSHQTFSTYVAPPLAPVSVTDTGFDSAALMTTTFGPVVPAGDCSRRHTSTVGRFLCSFDVPQLPYGSYPVTASDTGLNNATNTVEFSIVPGGLLFPSAGHVGSTIELAADGFPAYAPLSVVWDPGLPSASTVASWLTNSAGVASGSIVVPAAPFGPHTIEVVYSASLSVNLTFLVLGSLTVTPSSGYVGETGVLAVGEGFPADASVNASWDAGTALSVALGSGVSAGNGTVVIPFTVPTASFGVHSVSLAVGGFAYANGSFAIDVSNLTLDRTTAPAGGLFAAALTGFASSVATNLIWDLGLPTQSLIANGSTSELGAENFSGAVAPALAQAGAHIVTATDARGHMANATLWVGPAITLAPSRAPVGASVTVSGWTFPSGHAVELFWNSTSGPLLAQIPPGAGAAGYSYGNFSTEVTVPDVPYGAYSIVASIQGTSTTAVAPFFVSPSLALTPGTATVGTTIEATVHGLSAGALAIVSIDGAPTGLGTTTDANGTAQFSFVLPPTPAGTRRIEVVDAFGVRTAPVNLTVTPSVTVGSDVGYPGENVTVELAGFGADLWTTVAWDGVGTSTGVTTDAQGSASVVFSIPANATAAAHSIGAWDASANAAPPTGLTVLSLPVPVLLAPGNGTYTNRSAVQLSWGPVVGSGVRYSVVVSSDASGAGGIVVTSGDANSSWTTAPLADGTYVWHVEAVAPGGVARSASTNGTFVVDTVAPVSTVGPMPSMVRGLTVDVPFSASDPVPGSGLLGVRLLVSPDGGTDWSAYANGSLFTTSPIAFHAPHAGAYLFQTLAVDRAGNQQRSSPAGEAVVAFAPLSTSTNWAPAVFAVGLVALVIAGLALVPRRRRVPKAPAAPPQPWQETEGAEPSPPASGGRGGGA